MKWFFVLLTLLSSNLYGGDFRSLNWDDSFVTTLKKMKAEGLRPTQHRPAVIYYTTSLFGKEYLLTIDFNENKLHKATYSISESPKTDECLLYFLHLKKILVEKYGAPTIDQEEISHLPPFYMTKFKTERTTIQLYAKFGSSPVITITYSSVKYEKELDEKARKLGQKQKKEAEKQL